MDKKIMVFGNTEMKGKSARKSNVERCFRYW